MTSPKISRKRSRRKTPKRDHLPALSAEMRKMMQTQLDTMPVSKAAKQAVMASINAAANPSAEAPDVVIRAMETDDQQVILQAARGYEQTLGAVGMRGRMRLMMMSEEEWSALSDDNP